MSKQPTVLLPSGQTCRPMRLRSIYRGIREFRAYDEVYNNAFRISRDPYEDPDELWARNPYVVFSVYPADLAEYDPAKHPRVTRKRGQTRREARDEAENLAASHRARVKKAVDNHLAALSSL